MSINNKLFSLSQVDTFRRYFNPPIKATQEIGVALLFFRGYSNNVFESSSTYQNIAVG